MRSAPPATETVTRILDSPDFNRRLFLPPLYDGATPPDAQDVLVPVADGVRVHADVVVACAVQKDQALLC